MPTVESFPEKPAERNRWILDHRPRGRLQLDPARPHAFFWQWEPSTGTRSVPVATLFLTNRECPWKCLMCDLWQQTLRRSVPPGAIPRQIETALRELSASPEWRHPNRRMKLYNSGSFFDPNAIPLDDYERIADLTAGFQTVIVESHPALLGRRSLRFQALLPCPLEVAIGFETVHPIALHRLNKRVNRSHFQRASAFLQAHQIALRAFVLVNLPFVPRDENHTWTCRTIDFAFECGATIVALIPTRQGNGSLERLAQQHNFAPPGLTDLERALDYGIEVRRGRAVADLWDLRRLRRCDSCFDARRRRLETINRTQQPRPAIRCDQCLSRT